MSWRLCCIKVSSCEEMSIPLLVPKWVVAVEVSQPQHFGDFMRRVVPPKVAKVCLQDFQVVGVLTVVVDVVKEYCPYAAVEAQCCNVLGVHRELGPGICRYEAFVYKDQRTCGFRVVEVALRVHADPVGGSA
jgi:hypothetical protein